MEKPLRLCGFNGLTGKLNSWLFGGQTDYSFGHVTKPLVLTLCTQFDLKLVWGNVNSTAGHSCTALIKQALRGQLHPLWQTSSHQMLNVWTIWPWCPTQMVAVTLEGEGRGGEGRGEGTGTGGVRKWYSTCTVLSTQKQEPVRVRLVNLLYANKHSNQQEQQTTALASCVRALVGQSAGLFHPLTQVQAPQPPCHTIVCLV